MKFYSKIFIIIYCIKLNKILNIATNDINKQNSIPSYHEMDDENNQTMMNEYENKTESNNIYQDGIIDISDLIKHIQPEANLTYTPESKLTSEQQKKLIYKYGKYIGLVGRCFVFEMNSQEITKNMKCQLTEIGVFIYNNLLLTNFAWDIRQMRLLEERRRITGEHRKTVAAYITGGTLHSNLFGTDLVNYTQVHYLEDWRSFVSRITGTIVGSLEHVISTLPFVQLAILVGTAPLQMDGKTIDYLTVPIHSRILPLNDDEEIKDGCFIISYGGSYVIGFNKLEIIPVEILPNKICRENTILASALIDSLCIYIDKKEKWRADFFEPRSGEPVICDDELLCIISNASIYNSYKSLYPCTTVTEHFNWIQKHIANYGLNAPIDKYSKYMGMIVFCYKQSERPREYCVVIGIGVVIFDNLLLTTAQINRGFKYYQEKHGFWKAYIGGAKESLDTWGKQRIQLIDIVRVEYWQSFHSTYTSHALYIMVGENPFLLDRSNMDAIELPMEPLNLITHKCYMMTYGPILKSSFNASALRLHRVAVTIFDMYCSELDYTKQVRELCIGIDGNNINMIPYGGEPIICNDILYGIVTNRRCNNAENYNYYIIINVFDYINWITESMSFHGFKTKRGNHGKRCSCSMTFFIFIIIFTYLSINC